MPANGNISFASIFIWLFVIVVGIELGAGLYETIVVLPTWTAHAPESVLEYYKHNVAYPQFAITAGPRFWMIQTPLAGLMALLTFVTAFKSAPEHRKWRLIGSGLVLLVVAATFAWFVPNIMALTGEKVTTMTPDQITSTTNWWVRLNWVRVVVYVSGWLAGIKALTIPISRADN